MASALYDVAAFKAGKSRLKPVEREELPDVRGNSLLHIQCHFGLDTLCWAREGAIVTGIDFSQNALEAARALADECGIDARFIHSDVYSLPEKLSEQFDIVFTSYGALCWLPDMERWADEVRRLGAAALFREGDETCLDQPPRVALFVFLELLLIQLNAQTGALRQVDEALDVDVQRLGEDEVPVLRKPVGRVVRELDVGDPRRSCGAVQVRDHPDTVGPGVRREHLACSLDHGPDLAGRGGSADGRAVRLVDVEAALLEIRLALLRPAVQLAACDAEYGRVALQLGEAVVVVGVERLFEPVHAVLFARLDDANRGFLVPAAELAVGGV